VRGQALLDAWFPLWPLVFQPALGVLMLGAVRSPSLQTPFLLAGSQHRPASDVQGRFTLLGGFTHAQLACMAAGMILPASYCVTSVCFLWVQLVSGAVGWARENSGGG